MKAIIEKAGFKISLLNKSHDKDAFDSSHAALNNYLKKLANQDMKRRIAVTYVITDSLENSVLGYYTLASTSIDIGVLPMGFSKRLPKYPIIPATLVGRLAVDRRFKGKGLGARLLIDALRRSFDASSAIGAVAVVVSAKDENAPDFYKHYSFIPFHDDRLKLFLPMEEVKKLFT